MFTNDFGILKESNFKLLVPMWFKIVKVIDLAVFFGIGPFQTSDYEWKMLESKIYLSQGKGLKYLNITS